MVAPMHYRWWRRWQRSSSTSVSKLFRHHWKLEDASGVSGLAIKWYVFQVYVQSIFYKTINPQFSMLWMIDLLVKDLPGVDYPLLDARIWEHFDVAAPCIVFLSVLYYGNIFFETTMVTFLLLKSHAFAIAGYNLLCFHASVVALWEHFSG